MPHTTDAAPGLDNYAKSWMTGFLKTDFHTFRHQNHGHGRHLQHLQLPDPPQIVHSMITTITSLPSTIPAITAFVPVPQTSHRSQTLALNRWLTHQPIIGPTLVARPHGTHVLDTQFRKDH